MLDPNIARPLGLGTILLIFAATVVALSIGIPAYFRALPILAQLMGL